MFEFSLIPTVKSTDAIDIIDGATERACIGGFTLNDEIRLIDTCEAMDTITDDEARDLLNYVIGIYYI
jgi:hypothetical protein